jgi:diguanylate cyclase (GGDEF)-like protein
MFRKSLRRIDIPCRFGGEEFAIILPGTRLPQAMRTAERLRALLAESKFDAEGQPVRLTASFGVDTYSAEEQLAADDFIKRADQLLLEAKAEGRNRVCQRSLEAAEPLTEITAEERAMLYVSQRASKEP